MQKTEKGQFLQTGRQTIPFPTCHCPVPSSHANGQHGRGARHPHTTCQKMLGFRSHRAHGPALPASRAFRASCCNATLQTPCPSPTGVVKNRGGWRGDKRVVAGPRASQPGAASAADRKWDDEGMLRALGLAACDREMRKRAGGRRDEGVAAGHWLPPRVLPSRQGHHTHCSQQSAHARKPRSTNWLRATGYHLSPLPFLHYWSVYPDRVQNVTETCRR